MVSKATKKLEAFLNSARANLALGKLKGLIVVIVVTEICFHTAPFWCAGAPRILTRRPDAVAASLNVILADCLGNPLCGITASCVP